MADDAPTPDVPETDDTALATEDTPERQEQEVTIEDTGPARKKMTITIPRARIETKLNENIDELKEEAQVPGFRRGRAPRRLIEKRFGSDVRKELTGQLIGESYQQALEENSFDVIGEPDIKVDEIELPDEGDMTFEVEIEVAPDVELPDLESIELKKPKVEESNDKVEKEIENLKERFGEMSKVEDVEISAGDFVQADVRILEGENADDDAEEIASHPGTYIMVRGENEDYRGHVAGIVIEDLGKQLIGKKPGEEIEISMTGPESHENERIKKAPITIRIKLDSVERLEPADMDTVLEQTGVESEDDLKERIRESLKNRAEQEQTQAMQEQVKDYLVDNVNLDLPEGLTGRQTERLMQRERMMLAYQGVPEPEIDQRMADMRSESEEQAIRELKLFFIMQQAAKELDIEVTEQEVNGRITMMAIQQGRRPEKMRQEMRQRGELEMMELQLREDKTLDAIIEKANVTEVDPSELEDADEDE